MGRETPLFELHRILGARIVEFGGWSMPLHYGSQVEEHHAVRRAAGVFDVSHMGIVDVSGPDARALLETLLANDVGKLKSAGKALYSCMLEGSGGVVDDLIVYFLGPEPGFRVVVNGATRDGDLAWIRRHAAGRNVGIAERTDLAQLAVQGPVARERVATLLAELSGPGEAEAALQLEGFQGLSIGRWFVARTGYTGEDGLEVMMPAAEAERTWRQLNSLGVKSCGLGARDTLRLEAGLNLYGADMDRSMHPYESGLGWTVALAPRTRHFVGRAALEAVVAGGSPRKLVGLV
ncbi:MAG: glycine cleavage system aminomethyltransferase GcvT, partial [Steroidobacteraceae bacterium]